MSQPFNLTLHRRLWDYAAQYPGMRRKGILEKFFTPEEIKLFGDQKSVACEWVIQTTKCHPLVVKCKECPFNLDHNELWTGAVHFCLGGLLYKWYEAVTNVYDSPWQITEAASVIRDLPVRDDVETI